MNTERSKARAVPTSSWPLVLCLVGLDYFSTLAYLPSLAVQAAGPLAPLAGLVVVAVTLLAGLPVYLYVVGRSPHGRGGIGLLEQRTRGWGAKFGILLLLGFVATDFIVTQNISAAAAAEHLRGNTGFRQAADWLGHTGWHPRQWLRHDGWQWLVSLADRQLTITLALSLIIGGLWSLWRSGSTRTFLRIAVVVVTGYLLLNALVIGSGILYLQGEGEPLQAAWVDAARRAWEADPAPSGSSIPWSGALFLALGCFPYVALGLSGFELSMAVAPLVKGDPADTPQIPAGRIRNMRKLLLSAAAIMALFLPAAIYVTALLVPPETLQEGGEAAFRGLSYLAHGGRLADGRSGQALPLCGPAFGNLYDGWTVCILCLAGASVAIALRNFVPEYLQRFGMEMEWAEWLGMKLQFFTLIVLTVSVLFRARITALQWVYTTSVLVLLSASSLAAVVDLRQRAPASIERWLLWPFRICSMFFVSTVCSTLFISRSGLEIALAFCAGIVATSCISRWIRSTELRFEGFAFADAASEIRWQSLCETGLEVLVPHRPGRHTRAEKEQKLRAFHRLPADVPVVFVEAELGDPSNFYQRPVMRITYDKRQWLIRVMGCASIPHVLAAMGIELARSGRPPEIHFGWSDESPVAAQIDFLLFGQGNIPWMVRELVLKAEPDPARRPKVILG